MASLREDFSHFYSPDDDAIADALRTGVVSVDTNVLLDLYRFQPRARNDLFGALEIIGDRLWIPYQVAFEFHRNRLSVIATQESYFSTTREVLDKAMEEYLSRLRAFIKRVSMPPSQVGNVEGRIQKAHEAVMSWVLHAEKSNQIHLDNRDSDEVLRRLETLFSNRVGEPMTAEDLEKARKEANRRATANPKIPPGYMDKDKSDPSGDYILWQQLIEEAGKRKVPVVLITGDRKEDWFWREHGQTIGARYELREEMESKAGVPFLIMTTDTFLIHAEKYLKATVSPETVSQAKELPESLIIEQSDRTEQEYRLRLDNLMRDQAALDQSMMSTQMQRDSLEHHLETIVRQHQDQPPDEQVRAEIDQLRGRIFVLRKDLQSMLAERDRINRAANDTAAAIASIHNLRQSQR